MDQRTPNENRYTPTSAPWACQFPPRETSNQQFQPTQNEPRRSPSYPYSSQQFQQLFPADAGFAHHPQSWPMLQNATPSFFPPGHNFLPFRQSQEQHPAFSGGFQPPPTFAPTVYAAPHASIPNYQVRQLPLQRLAVADPLQPPQNWQFMQNATHQGIRYDQGFSQQPISISHAAPEPLHRYQGGLQHDSKARYTAPQSLQPFHRGLERQVLMQNAAYNGVQPYEGLHQRQYGNGEMHGRSNHQQYQPFSNPTSGTLGYFHAPGSTPTRAEHDPNAFNPNPRTLAATAGSSQPPYLPIDNGPSSSRGSPIGIDSPVVVEPKPIFKAPAYYRERLRHIEAHFVRLEGQCVWHEDERRWIESFKAAPVKKRYEYCEHRWAEGNEEAFEHFREDVQTYPDFQSTWRDLAYFNSMRLEAEKIEGGDEKRAALERIDLLLEKSRRQSRESIAAMKMKDRAMHEKTKRGKEVMKRKQNGKDTQGYHGNGVKKRIRKKGVTGTLANKKDNTVYTKDDTNPSGLGPSTGETTPHEDAKLTDSDAEGQVDDMFAVSLNPEALQHGVNTGKYSKEYHTMMATGVGRDQDDSGKKAASNPCIIDSLDGKGLDNDAASASASMTKHFKVLDKAQATEEVGHQADGSGEKPGFQSATLEYILDQWDEDEPEEGG